MSSITSILSIDEQ
jgi:glucose-6-phosphate dehydrogenase assembly protein OpcA